MANHIPWKLQLKTMDDALGDAVQALWLPGLQSTPCCCLLKVANSFHLTGQLGGVRYASFPPSFSKVNFRCLQGG
jgi:hypothetical protein